MAFSPKLELKLLLPFCMGLMICASSSSALLIDNGMSTTDTDTNLEWLDLTATNGLSYADALSSTFVTIDGYRSATSLEVAQLFTDA